MKVEYADLVDLANIQRLVKAAVLAEREACARLAEETPARKGCDGGVQRILADDIAEAIRARGGK